MSSTVRRRRYQLIASLLILFAGTGARAQAPAQAAPAKAAPSSKIAAITVSGAMKIPADQIVSASGLKAGDVVTVEQIKGAADRLAALGIFSAVNYRYSAKGDAIALEFQVTEAPTYPLSFDNFPWLTDAEIGEAIRGERGAVYGGIAGGRRDGGSDHRSAGKTAGLEKHQGRRCRISCWRRRPATG